MKGRIGLKGYALLAILPFVLVVAASLQTASRGRLAFGEMKSTLEALGETTRLEAKIRKGINSQLVAATSYLRVPGDEAWADFTQLAWSVYEDEARYLALPLTAEERLSVERVRTQHRLFEGIAQGAMARRRIESGPDDLREMQRAFSQVDEALEEVSRMIQERLATATASAAQASSQTGFVLAALAILFALALALSSSLVLRGVLGPLEGLQAAAARLGHGDLAVRAPVRGVPAVAQVCDRFNAMAAELEALLQRLEERVDARTTQLAALESVSRAGLANLDREALLRKVLERMTTVAGADGGNIRVVQGNLLVSEAQEGLPEAVAGAPLPADRQPTARAMETRRAVWMEDLSADAHPSPLVAQGFRAMVAVPLVVRDRVAGAVGLFFKAPRARDGDLIRVLEAMAARAALALERGEMVREILRNAEELRTANQRLMQTQQRLVEAERVAAVGQVHIALRHEINNPLTVLVGAADILEQRADEPAVVREWARHMAEAAARITEVLRRLEDLRHVETTSYGAEAAMVDLGSLPSEIAGAEDPKKRS